MNERRGINDLQREIKEDLLSVWADVVGFADISDIRFSNREELRNAIVIGIAYHPKIIERVDSDIDAFKNHLLEIKETMEGLLKVCDQFLRHYNYASWVPPISQVLPGLLSDFSHKMAATKAGLGWVGKNSLFVSKEFGCRVRLATVLTNAPFIAGKPITKSRCGHCTKCIEACPYGAIKGENWYPGIEREKLLDAFLCSRKREEFIPTLGYKHPCGLCIKACPVGKRKNRKSMMSESE